MRRVERAMLRIEEIGAVDRRERGIRSSRRAEQDRVERAVAVEDGVLDERVELLLHRALERGRELARLQPLRVEELRGLEPAFEDAADLRACARRRQQPLRVCTADLRLV